MGRKPCAVRIALGRARVEGGKGKRRGEKKLKGGLRGYAIIAHEVRERKKRRVSSLGKGGRGMKGSWDSKIKHGGEASTLGSPEEKFQK